MLMRVGIMMGTIRNIIKIIHFGGHSRSECMNISGLFFVNPIHLIAIECILNNNQRQSK